MWKMRYIFFFQCPQCNLLRNEYDIPFINIYHFNKINDFINPALIHDAKLACKFIKEAMFLENIHQSTKTNLQTASSFNISSDLLLLLSEMCTCLRFSYAMYEYFNNYVITKCLLSCDIPAFNVNWITPIYCAISIKILNLIESKGIFLSYVRDVPSMFWRIKWYGTLCANKQNSVQGVPGFEVVQKESRWRNRLSFFLT
jgi:hypothetical protein